MFRRRPMRHALFTVAVGLPAAVLIASVFAAPVAALQGPGQAPGVAASPSPSLCVPAGSPTPVSSTSLPTLTPAPTSLPLPSASPSAPAVLPSPTPSLPFATCPTPSPSPGGSPPPTIPGTQGGGAGNGQGFAGTTISASTLRGLDAGFLPGGLSLWSRVATILRSPLSAGPPDLVHFPNQSSAAAPHSVTAGFLGGGGPGPSVLATAGVLGGGFVLAVLVLLRWRRQPRRSLRGMAWVCSAAAAVIFGPAGLLELSDLHGSSPAPSASAPATWQAASQYHAVSSPVRPAAATSLRLPTAAWSALSGIETSIAQTQSQLADNEAEIARVTAQAAQPASASANADAPPIRSGNGGGVTSTSILTQLVQSHQSLATAYSRELQAEYQFYVAAAQSPVQAAELQSGASSGPGAVQQAVATDIDLVRTQLAQEAAIAAATAAPQGVTAPGSSRSGPVSAAGVAPAVIFQPPLSGVVSQSFGPSSLAMELPVVYNGVFYPHFHTGLDVAAPLDMPVGAAAAGRVIFAGQSRDAAGHLVGYGNYVVIRHADGSISLYGHLDRILVSDGQSVAQSQEIGLCGSTGNSTGPHVHFEIRISGQPVDPAPYLVRA